MKTMKLLAFLGAYLTVCSGTSLSLDIRRALALQSIQGQSLSSFPTSGSKCNALRECLDCNTARICMPGSDGLEQIATVNCTALNPKTPFCNVNNGLCSATPSDNCAPADEKFTCPLEDGIYPDPLSCKRYHICIERFDTTIPCPTNNVYDHSQGECKLQRLSSDCVTFNCAGKEGQDIIYPKDDTVWGMCANGRAYILGRCESYEMYDTLNKTCTRVCRAVGNQPHDTDCNKYIRCSESAPRRYQMTEYPCPPSQGFDESVLKCTSDAACLKKDKPKENEDVKTADGDVEAQVDNSGNGDSSNITVSLLINNSGDNNNQVINEDDAIDGTEVNGNNNSDNGNSGNVGSGSQIKPSVLIVNSAGSNNSNDSVQNGDDNVVGSLVNGNGNGINISSSRIVNGNDIVNGSVIDGSRNDSSNVTSGNVDDDSGTFDSSVGEQSSNLNREEDVSEGGDRRRGEHHSSSASSESSDSSKSLESSDSSESSESSEESK